MKEHKSVKIGDAESSVFTVYCKVDDLLKKENSLYRNYRAKQIRMGSNRLPLLNKMKNYSITEFGKGYFRVERILKTVNVE